MRELLGDSKRRKRPIIDYIGGSTKVLKAVRRLKDNKATGADKMHWKLLKLLDEDRIDFLTRVFNKIYETVSIPQ